MAGQGWNSRTPPALEPSRPVGEGLALRRYRKHKSQDRLEGELASRDWVGLSCSPGWDDRNARTLVAK